jgi:hypothetical protein
MNDPQLTEILPQLHHYLSDYLTLDRGLTEMEIEHLLADSLGELSALVPPEIKYLYTWHNGDRDYAENLDGILAGYQFLPLQAVLGEYQQLLQLNETVGYPVWQSTWLPIFPMDSKQFCIVMLGRDGIYEIFLEDGTPHLLFENFSQMLRVIATAYDRGAYQWRSHQGYAQIQVEEQGLAEIIRTVQSDYRAEVLGKLQTVTTSADLEAIAHALIQLKDPDSVPYLYQFLESSTDVPLLMDTINILAEIKAPSTLGYLHKLLVTTDDYRIKVSVLSALFSFAHPDTMEYLPQELRSMDDVVRSLAISVLHSICTQNPSLPIPPELIQLLEVHLNDPNLPLCITSAGILCRLSHAPALDTLTQLADHPNPVVRLKVLASLAVCPDPRALTIVSSRMDDPDSQVQATARHIHQCLMGLQS